MSDFIGLIPARYASTRFPGKPLVLIHGKMMIERVFIQASKVLKHVYIATDDLRIAEAVKTFTDHVIMTSEHHQSGTDRCAEALIKFHASQNQKVRVVINIQGDEPFISPIQIQTLMNCFQDSETQIATLVKPIHEKELFDPNHVKVVLNNKKEALYFSRSPIPFIRGKENAEWLHNFNFYKHVGIYAYRTAILSELTNLKPSSLEKAESLEQLRWLENGYRITVEHTDIESISVDTPADLEKINLMDFSD